MNYNLILSLPMYPELSKNEIEYVCQKITEFYKDYKIFKKIVLDPIKTEGKPGELAYINLESINKKLNLNFVKLFVKILYFSLNYFLSLNKTK